MLQAHSAATSTPWPVLAFAENPKNAPIDANGNLTSDGAKTYEWDGENRLTAINQGTHRSEFSYDGYGRRVGIVEKDGGAVTSSKKYLWDFEAIAEERDSTGATATKRYFDGGFQEGANVYFYTRDHLESVREVVDATGTVRARYDYDPYGRRTKVSGDVDADVGYTGHFEHAPSGLKLTLYRAYDPVLGRWLSRDPAGLKGGPNLYAYVWGDPTNSVDPLGLEASLLTHAEAYAGNLILGYTDMMPIFWVLPDGGLQKHLRDAVQESESTKTGFFLAMIVPVGGEEKCALKGARFAEHHVFPRAFRAFFARAGIDIDKFLVKIPEEWHQQWVHAGKGEGIGGRWLNSWRNFIAEHPQATEREIWDHLYSMIEGSPGLCPLK